MQKLPILLLFLLPCFTAGVEGMPAAASYMSLEELKQMEVCER